ncbi:MAG: F0F1 ATP synthase subunit B [Deltaproteobacteria bacterium]|nr:MAG: F0F1 ATP synthase subunit B [Deltaproteobacteria bacterium]
MLINWFTVIAQIVNFLILVFLLKYFLYDRVIRAMDQREQKIQQRLQEAEEKKQEAEQEARSYLEKNRDFDAKREEMLAQAKNEADARRKELTEKARLAVNNLRSVWLETIQRDKKSFVQDLRKMAGNQVYTIARKAFRDLADEDVEEKTINAFLVHLKGMSKKTREALATSIKESKNEVIVRSAFEIPAKMREKITGALHREIADGIQVRYEPALDLIMGIELKTRGRKIAWSLQDYLDTLEEHALQALETEAQRKHTGASAEQGKEPEQEQLPETKRARPKRANRKQPKETNETTTQ